MKPCLKNERVWGSRAYVTLPPEIGRDHARKLHDPRGWMGYWVRNEVELICRVFSEDKKKVFRVSVTRVEDGEGLDDPYDDLSIADRLPVPDNLPPAEISSSDDDTSAI
jgi:hypothetical protein